MKKYTSKFLRATAFAYLAFPITYLIATTVLFDIPSNRALALLLSPSYLIISAVAMFTGYNLWEMKRWTWYLFLSVHFILFYYSAILAFEYGETHNRALSLGFAWLLLFALLVRVAREIRVPYFLPNIRWWESNPRYKLIVPVSIVRNQDPSQIGPITGDIMDISQGGCFVKMRTDVRQDETIVLQFKLFGQEIQCPGVIVWKTQSTVTHPRGVGIKFGVLAKSDRKVLRAAIKRLKSIQTLYRTSRYLLNQEDFLKKLTSLETQELEVAKTLKKIK